MAMEPVAAISAPATRPQTEDSELAFVRVLVRTALVNISFFRRLFPYYCYEERTIPSVPQEIQKFTLKLQPWDQNSSKRFIDWMEKGVFDALKRKYLRTMFLTICRGQDGPLVEEYVFSFKYASTEASEDIIYIFESSSGKHVAHSDTSNQTSLQNMRCSASNMMFTLMKLVHILDNVPNERTIAMKLHYYDDVTPEDYEPPLFTSSTHDDPYPLACESHKVKGLKIGQVDGRSYKVSMKMKTVIHSCHDDDSSTSSEATSLSTGSEATSLSTSSEAMDVDTELSQPCSQPSQPSQKILPPMGSVIQASESEVRVAFEEKAEHFEFEAESLRSMDRRNLQKREEITVHMRNIIRERLQISKTECMKGTKSNDIQQHYEPKTNSPLSNAEKDKISEAEKVSGADVKHPSLYAMALFYTLPREHITMQQLKEALLDVCTPSRISLLMAQMSRDGYIENTPRVRRKGQQVFHTLTAEKKLQELCASFNSKIQKNDKPQEGPSKSYWVPNFTRMMEIYELKDDKGKMLRLHDSDSPQGIDMDRDGAVTHPRKSSKVAFPIYLRHGCENALDFHYKPPYKPSPTNP